MTHPVIVIGAGGHAKVVIDIVRLSGDQIIGATDYDLNKTGMNILGIPIIGDDKAIMEYTPDQIQLVNGVGSVGMPELRTSIFNRFSSLGYSFRSVMHPSAIIASDVIIGEGVQIMAGAIIQPGCHIGSNSILNTKASVDHDCYIGSNVHLAPGVTLSGGIEVGDGVHIGTGAVIIQGIKIGRNSLIGAGAVVVKDVAANSRVMGVPAREV